MNKIFGITSLVAIAFTGVSSAIERLTPIKEPQVRSASTPEAEAQPKAWLGVVGQPVDKALAAQLNIPYGVTLELVDPKGSAAKAGIKKFDVITKIGEKPIKEMGDLRDAMGKAKVNEIVAIEVLSAGNRLIKKVKLEARPSYFPQISKAPKPKTKQQAFQHLPHTFQHLPLADQDRIEQMIQAQIRQMQEYFAQMDEQMLDMQKLHEDAMRLDLEDLRMKGTGHYSGTFTMMDEEGSIRITLDDASGKQVEVKDKAGKILYKGSYETEEDKKAVPADVRARIEALGIGRSENGGGLKFHFGR